MSDSESGQSDASSLVSVVVLVEVYSFYRGILPRFYFPYGKVLTTGNKIRLAYHGGDETRVRERSHEALSMTEADMASLQYASKVR